MDSNHRRLRQLSYSQPHLATLVTALVLKNSLLFCGYKYRTFSIRCKILNTKIQRIIWENSTYSPISLTTKLIFTYGVYIHVYPNCTLISVNMYINIILYSRESFPAKVFPTPSWHVHLRRKRIYEKKYSSILPEV